MGGMLLALRGGQGAALEAAADGFLDACRAGADLPLPPFVRASMEAPLLLSAAGTVLADVGSPHALISASAAFWRPGSGSASGSAGASGAGSPARSPPRTPKGGSPPSSSPASPKSSRRKKKERAPATPAARL